VDFVNDKDIRLGVIDLDDLKWNFAGQVAWWYQRVRVIGQLSCHHIFVALPSARHCISGWGTDPELATDTPDFHMDITQRVRQFPFARKPVSQNVRDDFFKLWL
jgi:hypothetical protein